MRLPVLLLWICVTFAQCVLAAEPVPGMLCEPPGTTLATCDSASALRCPAPSSLVTRAASKRAAPVATAASAVGPVAALDNTVKFVSDNATLDLNGNTTLSGNVRIQQGDREIRADNVEYQADNNAFHVKGSVEYRDPVIRARGGEGQYSQTGGATFKGAEFELPERPARGSARDMRLDANGVVTLDAVSFSTCPAAKPDWRIRAKSIELDTRGRMDIARISGTAVRRGCRCGGQADGQPAADVPRLEARADQSCLPWGGGAT